MPLISFTMAMFMGLCLYAGAHFLIYFTTNYKTNSHDTLYLIFSAMCFFIIGFIGCELIAYQSHDPSTYAKAFQWRLAFGMLFLITWPWFVFRYSQSGPQWLVVGLSVYNGIFWLLNWFRANGIMFDTPPAIIRETLPWGETITFHAERYLPFPAILGWIGVIATIGYGIYACFRQYRRGQHRRAITLTIATVVFASLLLENMLVMVGILDFVFLAQYGFPAFMVIMGAALHRELLTQARRIQAIIDHVPAVIYMKNDEGRYLLANRQYEWLSGTSRTRIVGKKDIDLFGKERGDIFHANDRTVLKDGKAMEFEETVLHPDGTLHTYQSIKFPIQDSDYESYVVCGVSSDITERKLAEKQLIQNESKFRTLFETAGDAILLMRGDRFIDCNLHAQTMFGCRREDIVGNTPMAFSPPIQYDGSNSTTSALEKINAALAGETQFFPWRHCKLDGSEFDAEVSLNRIDLDSQPCLQAVVRDVTARRRTEEVIKNIATGVSAKTGDDFFRQLVIYLGKLLDTKYTFIGLIDDKNPLQVKTLALSIDSVIADNIRYRIENTPCANVVGKSTCAYPSGVQQKFPEDQLLRQLNVEGYIGTPLFDSSGNPVGLIVLLDEKPLHQIEWMREILQIFAARAGAELERLRMTQDLFIKRRAMEAATEGIVLMDVSEQNMIVYANRAMEHLTGYTGEELLGQSLQLLEGRDSDPVTVDKLRAAFKKRQPCHAEIVNYRKDGSPFWNEITITPVRNDSGKVTHFIATQLDISQRRQTEEALRRSQKMEALGQMAGGIAHDFNNQLGIIIGYLDLLRPRLAHEEVTEKWIETATQSTLRCIELTRQLLSFSRRQTTESTIVDLKLELSKMETLITRSVTPAVTVRVVSEEELWPVSVNCGELQDVVLNLVINARDAMPEGGRLVIEAANKVVDAEYARFNPELNPGHYVQIKVSDNGQGMDAGTLERVFEPFFTTKPEGKGTGLGLAMVFGFAKRYGGEVQAESELGVGTTFRLYLPRAIETHQNASQAEAQSHPPPGGTESILIVDDEEELLQLARQYLEPLGYCTFTASNSTEALKLLTCHTNIDLLFSDIVMPGDYDGFALAKRAAKLLPHLKVLLTSGYSSQNVAGTSEEFFATHVLRKPYRQDDLAKCIRAILDREAGRVGDAQPLNSTGVHLAGRTILVVDDDQDVRDLFTLNLEKLGCKIIPARNGSEAITLYRQSLLHKDTPIDAIILDLNLSAASLDGNKIADKIRSMDPQARVIVASGHSESPEMTHSRDFGFQGAIEKDFDRETIKKLLTQVLS